MNKWIVGIIVVVITVGVGLALGLHLFVAAPQLHSAQLLPLPKALVDVKLEKNKAELFTAENFANHWSLIFFGFTNCPDFCPLELQKLGKVLQLAQQANPQSDFPLQVIFISLDPERDTPDKMKTYTAFFHAQIQGLSGSNFELAKVAHFFGSDYSRSAVKAGAVLNIPAGIDMPSNVENDYKVAHSARIYIVNPQSAYIGSFAPLHNAEQMWADLQLIISKYKPAVM